MAEVIQSGAVVRFKTPFRNTILDVLKNRKGWVQVAEDDKEFDFYWSDKTWVKTELARHPLREFQRLNHFPNFYELCRKDNLSKNLKKAKRQAEKERTEEAENYGFFPTTYTLPQDYPIFIEEFKRVLAQSKIRANQQQQQQIWWIMKPSGKSQGKGIFLFNSLTQISDWKEKNAETYVVQRYISSPYLVGGRKFDMRIYVLVLQYSPNIIAYMHRAGFARLTFQRYSMSSESMVNSFVHLTNVAIQKHSETYDATSGCKWDLRTLRLNVVRKHGTEAADKAFFALQQAVINTLLAVQHVMVSDKRCFEMYGFDVLFDSDLHPFVLEVNASPSMTAENPRDHNLKSVVLNDALDLVDLEHKRSSVDQFPDHVGGFDLIKNGSWTRSSCTLGFYAPKVHGPPLEAQTTQSMSGIEETETDE